MKACIESGLAPFEIDFNQVNIRKKTGIYKKARIIGYEFPGASILL